MSEVFWRAPEVVNGNELGFGENIDVWSTGCIAVEMWTGTRPWGARNEQAVYNKVRISHVSTTMRTLSARNLSFVPREPITHRHSLHGSTFRPTRTNFGICVLYRTQTSSKSVLQLASSVNIATSSFPGAGSFPGWTQFGSRIRHALLMLRMIRCYPQCTSM